MAAVLWTLGVDPGRSGAAVLLRDRTLAAATSWKPATRNGAPYYKMRSWLDGYDPIRSRANTLHEVGKTFTNHFRLVATGPWAIACENFYVRQNVKTTVIMARNSGTIVGPATQFSMWDIEWVLATAWRKDTMRLSPWTGRGKAKDTARQFVPLLLSDRVAYDKALEALGDQGDVVDATGISVWLHMERTNGLTK